MPQRDVNNRSDARQRASRPDYRIQGEGSRVVSHGRNIKIQELSDDRWAVFVKARGPQGVFDPTNGFYYPVGPIHASPRDARRYLRSKGV